MLTRSLIARRGTVAFLGVFATFSAGCTHPEPEVSAAATLPTVQVATAQRGSISRTLSLAGQFQPYQVIDVHAKVSGFIRRIYVDIGDKVHAGETLAVLEVPELSAQLKGTVSQVAHSRDEVTRAQHMVSRAESQHAAVHSNYKRMQQASVTQPGLIAQQELDDARAKDLASEADVDAAKAALAAASQQTDVSSADQERVGALENYTRVTAPIDGVVTARYADTGALIQAGTASEVQSLALVKLSQSDLLRLRLPVPEDAVRYIHEGSQVQVRVDAVNRSFQGTVVRFTRNVNFATRTMETEVDVRNKDLSLTPGMYANTSLVLEQHKNTLTVPADAVMQNGSRSSVYVLDAQNRIEEEPVKLGIEGAKLVEVKTGLLEGDRVMVGGQSKFKPGSQVAVKMIPEPATDVEQEAGGATDESGSAAAQEGND